ncbi:MAG: hypothetical protein HYU41_14695 [Candidatus Rokubacteria bacterium]|nr:hypothetical protein [Candidatus Rokubacteria bacterium]
MLRITKTTEPGADAVTLQVEGRVVSEWVDVLERECCKALQEARTIRLDLGGVTFIDGRGVALFRRVGTPRLIVVNCSAFLQDLLRGGYEP